VSDEKLTDGIKLTLDAHEAGKLVALHDIEALLQDLTEAVRKRIAAIESIREGDD
jgi:hypothetical protein